jgi:ABC-type glycerol-3-phosphate transport system substrate-binding protein
MNAPRLLVLGAISATLLLAGCSAPTPDPAEPGDPSSAPSEPTVVSLAELDFPYESSDWLDSLDANRTTLADWNETYPVDCTAELAGSADSADCTEGILTGLQAVNGVKTSFDFSFDSADWDSGDYSGLVALAPTREAIQTASDSGSEFFDTCYYVPGQEGCVEKAQTFLDDTAAAVEIMATWER